MATLNVRTGSKVRLFVTPSRIKRGKPCQEKTCAISLAAVEQLGLTNVDTDYFGVKGNLPNGRKVTLRPLNAKHHEKFISQFDRTWLNPNRPLPKRTNITYKVTVS